MLDEGTLRERLPEIPWDQPVEVAVETGSGGAMSRWACRYCVVLDIFPFIHDTRDDALDHIGQVHHD